MTNLVSVLIALILMLTGAEGMNGHITLDDISVVVNNETYSPEFSASVGLEGDGETAVAEVAVNASGEVLFPLYAKIDDEAAYLQYGDTAPVALSRALIDSDDPTVTAFIDALGNYFEVYSSMLDMGPTAYLDAEQPIIDLLTEMGCLTEEDAVMLLDDGSEVEAVRRVITVDNEQMADFSVKIYDIIAPGYWDAYTNLMSAMAALMGVEDAVPTSIDDIMTMGDMQMTMSGEVLTAENGVEQGMMNVSMNMPIDEEMGYIILDIPMSVNVDENGVTTVVSDISYTIVDMDMPMHLEMTIDGDNAVMTLTSHLDYEGLITDILFTANQTADTFDGTFSFTANQDGTGFVLSAINQTTADLSVTDFYFSETENSDTLLSVAFSVIADSEAVEDHIGDAEDAVVIDSEEALANSGEAFSPITTALAVDSVKLTFNPELNEIIGAITEMYNSRVYSEEYTVDDKQATFEEEETFFYDDSCDPSELPFPAAFLNLEGYELVYENAFNGDAPSYCGYYSSNTGFIAIDAAPVGSNHVALYDADGNQLFTADDALLLTAISDEVTVVNYAIDGTGYTVTFNYTGMTEAEIIDAVRAVTYA